MNQDLELKLQAWLDGEMPESEAVGFSRSIASDPEAQQLIAELKSLKAALAQNEPAVKVPETREFYWNQIQRRIQHETPKPSPSFVENLVAHWRKLIVPVAGATAGLALLTVSLRQSMPVPGPAFTEVTDTSTDMEAVTFHDQKAGMTVVWLEFRGDETPKTESQPDFFSMP